MGLKSKKRRFFKPAASNPINYYMYMERKFMEYDITLSDERIYYKIDYMLYLARAYDLIENDVKTTRFRKLRHRAYESNVMNPCVLIDFVFIMDTSEYAAMQKTYQEPHAEEQAIMDKVFELYKDVPYYKIDEYIRTFGERVSPWRLMWDVTKTKTNAEDKLEYDAKIIDPRFIQEQHNQAFLAAVEADVLECAY